MLYFDLPIVSVGCRTLLKSILPECIKANEADSLVRRSIKHLVLHIAQVFLLVPIKGLSIFKFFSLLTLCFFSTWS